MARDVDYIVGGFQGLGQGLQGIASQMREDEEKRLAGAEKRFQERRPLPPEQQGMYQQLTGQPQMDPQAMKQEFIERRRAGEDPRAIAIDFKLRMQKGGLPEQGRYDRLGKLNTLGTMPSDEGAEPYEQSAPSFDPRAVSPVGGPATAQRPASMRDVASLQDLSAIGAQRLGAEAGLLRAQNTAQGADWREELARANLAARLRGLVQGDQRIAGMFGNLAMRQDEFGRREGLDYTKMAGEAPFIVPRLRTLIAQAPVRAPEQSDYIARRAAEVIGGRLGGLVRLGADAQLSQDERNFRREVSQVVQSYRRSEFGSQVTGLEAQISDMLAGEQLSVEDTIAALQALERLTANRLSRAQATVPGAAARIEGGASAINRGGGPSISPLPPTQPRASTPSDLGAASQSPGPGWVKQRNRNTGEERWFNPATGERR